MLITEHTTSTIRANEQPAVDNGQERWEQSVSLCNINVDTESSQTTIERLPDSPSRAPALLSAEDTELVDTVTIDY